jgi:hypothetical protein
VLGLAQRRKRTVAGLISWAAVALAGPAPASARDLALTLRHTSRSTDATGVTQTIEYGETFVRSGANVWRERILPAPAVHEHPSGDHGRKHLNVAAGARWIVAAGDASPSLMIVDRDERVVVEVDRVEWGNVGFDGSWPRAAQLVAPSDLAAMRPAGPERPDGTRWLERRSPQQVVRVLWDARLGYPLRVETRSLDGRTQRTTEALRIAMPAVRPWSTLDGYARKSFADYMD